MVIRPLPPRLLDPACRIVLLVAALALWAGRLEGPLDLRWDAGVYYSTGVALAHGDGYRLPSEPRDILAVQYPPGLPLLVAAAIRLLGTSDPDRVGTALRWVWLVLSIGQAQLGYSLARRWLHSLPALAAALTATLAVPTIFYSDVLFAELPFGIVVLGFLLLHRRPASRSRVALEWAVATVSFLLRTLGLAVLLAWVVERLFERRWKSALLRLVAVAVPTLLWSWYVRQVTHSDDFLHPAYEYQRADYQFHNVPYAQNLQLVDAFAPEEGQVTASAAAGRLVENTSRVVRSFGETLSTYARMLTIVTAKNLEEQIGLDRAIGRPIGTAFIWGVAFTSLLGLAALAFRGGRRAVLTVFLTAGMLATTPWPAQYPRYLMPFAMVLGIAWIAGLQTLARPPRPTWPSRVFRGGAAAAAVTLLALDCLAARDAFKTRARGPVRFAGPQSGTPGSRPFFYERPWSDFDEAVEWLRSRVAPADVIVATEPHYAWLRLGHKVILPPFEPDPAEAVRLLDTVPARYVIVDRFTHLDIGRRYALPAVESDPSRWQRVYGNPERGAQIFRRRE
jgi:hypothetical protein